MSQGCLPNCIFLLHIMLSRVPLHIVTESKDQTQVVGIVCESRIRALPYPFGSITESKIMCSNVFLPGEVVARFQTLSALSLSRGFVATLVNWSRLPSVVRVRGSVRAPTFRLSERGSEHREVVRVSPRELVRAAFVMWTCVRCDESVAVPLRSCASRVTDLT